MADLSDVGEVVFAYQSEAGVLHRDFYMEKLFPSAHRQLTKHSREVSTLGNVGAMSCNRRKGSARCKQKKKRGQCPREADNVGVGRCACDRINY